MIPALKRMFLDSDNDFEEVWQELRQHIDDLYFERPKPSFETMYRNIYRCCFYTAHNNDASRKETTGSVLVIKKLNDVLISYCDLITKDAQNSKNEELLEYYLQKFNHYYNFMEVLNLVFTYFNRLRGEEMIEQIFKISPRSKKLDVFEFGLIKWEECVLSKLLDEIIVVACDIIQREREGNKVNTVLIKQVIRSCQRLSNSIFENKLTDHILKATEFYYTNESYKCLIEQSFSTYLDKVEFWLHMEYRRDFLLWPTKTLLVDLANKLLIQDQLSLFEVNFLNYCKSKTENFIKIIQMLKLIKRVPEGKIEQYRIINNYIKNALQFIHIDSKSIDKERLDDVIRIFKLMACINQGEYLIYELTSAHLKNTLQYLHNYSNVTDYISEYLNMSIQCLIKVRSYNFNQNDSWFMIDHLDNYNNPEGAAEFLAVYCDNLIRKSYKYVTIYETQRLLDGVIHFYKYMDDKETFEHVYYAMFVERIVSSKSVNNDIELSMISKLKQVANITFTRKLQRILQEAECSPNAAECWSSVEDQSPAALAAELDKLSLADEDTLRIPRPSLTLPRAAWPLPLAPLPTSQRQSRDGDRNIALYVVSAVLATNCFRKRYTLHVSGAQALVLLQYNATHTHTIKQLAQNTQIHIWSLRQTVKQLVEARLLVYEGESRDSGCDSRSECRVSLNAEYSRSRAPSLYALARRDHYHASSLPLLQEWCVRSAKCARGARREDVSRQMRRHCAGRRTCTQLQAQECIEYLLSKRHLVEKEGVIKYWNQCVVKRNEREVCVDS